MVYRVFQATCENPIKNDFVKTCESYLQILGIEMTFEEIRDMSIFSFNKLVKEKVKLAGFKYLMDKKNEPGKQRKIAQLQYKKLEIQEYLMDGNKNSEISKLIFKARGKNLDIKEHKKWKYEDNLCIGCNTRTSRAALKCSAWVKLLLLL